MLVTNLTKKNETAKSFPQKNVLQPAHVGRKMKKSPSGLQLFAQVVRLIAEKQA